MLPVREGGLNCKLSLFSRSRKSFSRQYQHVFDALRDLPENTVVDGEIVALDVSGRFTNGDLGVSMIALRPLKIFDS